VPAGTAGPRFAARLAHGVFTFIARARLHIERGGNLLISSYYLLRNRTKYMRLDECTAWHQLPKF
jgi:hypothetical protein